MNTLRMRTTMKEFVIIHRCKRMASAKDKLLQKYTYLSKLGHEYSSLEDLPYTLCTEFYLVAKTIFPRAV